MIVIMAEKVGDATTVLPGDNFTLALTTNGEREVVLEEPIYEAAIIDYWCIFRFAREDGTCVGFHLGGFFGNRKALPDEIKRAAKIDDLPSDQFKNFCTSANLLGYLDQGPREDL